MKPFLCLLFLVALGCQSRPTTESAPSATDPAALREALMQADRDFAAATRARGIDGWVEWFGPNGSQVTARGEIAGEEGIRELMTAFLSDSTRALLWEPVRAEVSESGEIGYTVGRSRVASIGADGVEGPALARGMYLTIWRRQPDGSWKVETDIGSSQPVEE